MALSYAKWQPGKSTLLALPVSHVAGSIIGLLSVCQGTRAVMVREINPAELARVIPAQHVAYAFLTPTVIHMILAVPESANGDFSALEQVFYGASPISEDSLDVRYRRCSGYRLNVAQARPCRVGPGNFTPSLSQIRT